MGCAVERAGGGGRVGGPRASARGNPAKKGDTATEEANPQEKQPLTHRGKSAGTAGHGWSPRASARGNPACEAGARSPASLRAFHSPDFPPALAGGSPLGLGLFLRHRLRISFRLGQTGNRCVSGRKGITVGALAHARGETLQKRGNRQTEDKSRRHTGTVGALAQARGETRIKEGKTAKNAENLQAKKNSQTKQESRMHRGAAVGPSRKREGKPG